MTERSHRFPGVMITDKDFADDIALISDNLVKAQSLLERVENAATEVGLQISTSKTEYMAYNLQQQGDLTTQDNSKLRQMDDFKYVGFWID